MHMGHWNQLLHLIPESQQLHTGNMLNKKKTIMQCLLWLMRLEVNVNRLYSFLALLGLSILAEVMLMGMLSVLKRFL